MKLAILTFLLGGVMMIGWWIHRCCKAHLQAMVSQIARLRQDNRNLLNHNQQLIKQIEVRQVWQENLLDNLRPTLTQLADVHNRAHGIDTFSNIHCQLALLSRAPARLGTELALSYARYRMIDIIISVRACWQDELQHYGIRIERNIHLSDEMIELRQWGSDVILNAILAHALQRLAVGQSLFIECKAAEGRVVIRFADYGLSCAYLHGVRVMSGDGSELSLSALTRNTGGELIIFSTAHYNLVELSWPLAVQDVSQSDSGSGDPAQEVTSPQYDWLAKLEGLVGEHFADPDFSTARAARLLFLSERSLQRRFKQLTNQTFIEYLTRYRLKQACLQLRSGARVSHVAFECGFNEPSYFSQRFKQYYGLSPSQYIANGYQL